MTESTPVDVVYFLDLDLVWYTAEALHVMMALYAGTFRINVTLHIVTFIQNQKWKEGVPICDNKIPFHFTN